MKHIELTKGFIALVDDEDFEAINAMFWHVQPKAKTYYAIGATIANGKRTTRRMHRVIMKAKAEEQVDHINGNGLDNRKCNLRIVDASANAQNRKHYGQQPYKGVKFIQTLKSGEQLWAARISKNRKVETVGYFYSAVEAAKAYDLEASKRFGKNAYLNFKKEIA